MREREKGACKLKECTVKNQLKSSGDALHFQVNRVESCIIYKQS